MDAMLPTPLPAFSDNYIWALDHGGDGVVVVDPGDAEPVRRFLHDGRRLAGILLTHHHDDHIGGAAELIASTGARCFAPADPRIALDCERVGDGGSVEVAGLRFDVIGVPGHTLSHIAFVDKRRLFCGDTLFSLGCGRLFEGTPTQMLASLDRLAALDPDLLVCCGHEYTLANAGFAVAVEPGNTDLHALLPELQALRARALPTLPTTLARELACNPFLRTDKPAVQAAVAGRLGRPPLDRSECFAELRRWKDGFRPA
jgi:hydroxyacylglutathione hydrolase